MVKAGADKLFLLPAHCNECCRFTRRVINETIESVLTIIKERVGNLCQKVRTSVNISVSKDPFLRKAEKYSRNTRRNNQEKLRTIRAGVIVFTGPSLSLFG